MDIALFAEKLADLIQECGGSLAAAPIITIEPTRKQAFAAADRSEISDSCYATRSVDPLKIEVIILAESFGAWHHLSGDDRRLHPSLKLSSPLIADRRC